MSLQVFLNILLFLFWNFLFSSFLLTTSSPFGFLFGTVVPAAWARSLLLTEVRMIVEVNNFVIAFFVGPNSTSCRFESGDIIDLTDAWTFA